MIPLPTQVCSRILAIAAGFAVSASAYAACEFTGNPAPFMNCINDELQALQAQVVDLEVELAAANAWIDTASAYIEVDSVANTVTFTGANVYVQSGSGFTDDGGPLTGLGNLVIGYDVDGHPDDVGSDVDLKTGSHNLIVGDEHTYTSFGGVAFGFNNAITQISSVVSGGIRNQASGAWSAVTGGTANEASGPGSAVTGGEDNEASGTYASVTGGSDNTASWFYSSVGGGLHNEASSDGATVCGGSDNTSDGFASVVTGGRLNLADHNYSVVTGGKNNEASGDYSVASGGENNTASGDYSVVVGGLGNTASSDHDIVP